MRNHLLSILLFLFIFILTSTGNAIETNSNNDPGQINCFVYHRFGDNRYPSTNISVENFRLHLEYLKENDYTVLSLGDALDLLEKNSVPEKTVVLTIDDGYKSFYENAMPLLKEFDYPATLFINTRQFDSGDFLSIQQIKQLKNQGIEIGNHSHSHAYFLNIEPEARIDSFRNDLEISREIFKEKLGFQPELFAFPYGEYTSEMQEVLKEMKFKGAAAQKSGVIASFSNRFALPRFPMAGPFVKIERFIEKAKMKAMPVKPVNVKTPLINGNNPPKLKLDVIFPDEINKNQLQFFAGGKKQSSNQIEYENNTITVEADFRLKSRRTLYTITAPSKTTPAMWQWYSFLWIIPSVEE